MAFSRKMVRQHHGQESYNIYWSWYELIHVYKEWTKWYTVESLLGERSTGQKSKPGRNFVAHEYKILGEKKLLPKIAWTKEYLYPEGVCPKEIPLYSIFYFTRLTCNAVCENPINVFLHSGDPCAQWIHLGFKNRSPKQGTNGPATKWTSVHQNFEIKKTSCS